MAVTLNTELVPQWDDSVTDWDQPDVFWDITRSVLAPLPVNPGTIYVPFVPASGSNPQFQAAFDGSTYNVVLAWNVYGQRYYVNIYDLSQNPIVSLPLITSPNFANISMTEGYFTTSLVYRGDTQNFEIFG